MSLLSIVNEMTIEEHGEIDPAVGDRGLSQIDIEILLNVMDRAFTDIDTLDVRRIAAESDCWHNIQKTLNY